MRESISLAKPLCSVCNEPADKLYDDGTDSFERSWFSRLVGSYGAGAGACEGKRPRKNFVRGFTLHTKLVLTTTMILVFGGALLILALDWNHAPSLGSLKPAQKVMAAFSVRDDKNGRL